MAHSLPSTNPRHAGAPISWGVCEVPGWGVMLPPDRVFAEMASLGLTATELGPVDAYLPLDGEAIRTALDPHGLRLVGGFVPLALHGPDVGPAREEARRVATAMASAGADVFVLALVADAAWSPVPELDDAGWRRLGDHVDEIAEIVATLGMTLAIHPHHGTFVQHAPDVERLLAVSGAGWCLDPGHLIIGGVDPVAFAEQHGDRVVHVHLKDVDAGLAAAVGAGELGLMAGVQAGLFKPLGQGDARIGEVLDRLAAQDYDGWLVLEQDVAITGEEPPPGEGPIVSARQSLDYLAAQAVA